MYLYGIINLGFRYIVNIFFYFEVYVFNFYGYFDVVYVDYFFKNILDYLFKFVYGFILKISYKYNVIVVFLIELKYIVQCFVNEEVVWFYCFFIKLCYDFLDIYIVVIYRNNKLVFFFNV